MCFLLFLWGGRVNQAFGHRICLGFWLETVLHVKPHQTTNMITMYPPTRDDTLWDFRLSHYQVAFLDRASRH